jgi:hypothetical protein
LSNPAGAKPIVAEKKHGTLSEIVPAAGQPITKASEITAYPSIPLESMAGTEPTQPAGTKPAVADKLKVSAAKVLSVSSQEFTPASSRQIAVRPQQENLTDEKPVLASLATAKRVVGLNQPDIPIGQAKPRIVASKLAAETVARICARPYSFNQPVNAEISAQAVQAKPIEKAQPEVAELMQVTKPVAESVGVSHVSSAAKPAYPVVEAIVKPVANGLLPLPVFKFATQSQAEPTTLKLSIGRIQVRAKQPEPPTAPRPAARPNRLSLAEYLQNTNQGRLT